MSATAALVTNGAKRACTRIGTHNGSFHCDEILACFMLKQLPLYKDAVIIRSRDPSQLDECDIVVDVGGVFDAAKNRFDHHQRSFTDTFASLNAAKPWTIKLSSAGLIYVHFGRQVIEQIVMGLTHEKSVDENLLDILYDKMYEQFVREIDAIDNGVEIADTKKYDISTNLSSRVSFLNPAWNDKEPNEMKQFEVALDLVGGEFVDRIRYYVLVWWPARSIVTNALNNRFKVDPSGSIIHIDTSAPWKAHLFDLEKELGLTNEEIKYAIYQDSSVPPTWRVQCVPQNENSFINRLSLPAAWCGVRDDALSTLSEIEGCIFVHANGFIGGNKTYEGALKMLQKSLLLNKKAD